MSLNFAQSILYACIGVRQRNTGPTDSQIEAAKERIRKLQIPNEDEYHRRGPAPQPGMVYGRQDLDASLELIHTQTSAFNNTGPPPRRPLRHHSIPEVPQSTKEELDKAFSIGEDSDDEDEDGNADGNAQRLVFKEDKMIADVSKDVGRNLYTNGHPLNPLTPEEEASAAEKPGVGKSWVNKPTVANAPKPTGESSDIKDDELSQASTVGGKVEVKDSSKPRFDHYWKESSNKNSLEISASAPKVRNLTTQYHGSMESLTRAKLVEAENLAKKAAHNNDVKGHSENGKSTVSRELTGKEGLNSSKFIHDESKWTEIDLHNEDSGAVSSGPSSSTSTSAPPRALRRARNLCDMVIDGSSSPQKQLELESNSTAMLSKSRFTENLEEILELPKTDKELVKSEQPAGQSSEKVSDIVQNDEAHEGKDGCAETKTEQVSEGGKFGISRRNARNTQSYGAPTPTIVRPGVQTLHDELAGTDFVEGESYYEY